MLKLKFNFNLKEIAYSVPRVEIDKMLTLPEFGIRNLSKKGRNR